MPTPLSSTSLSSPFIAHGQSPCVSTPSNGAVAPSPMASRHYNVPYNPRDWGPVSSSSGSTAQSPYPQSSSSGSMRRMVHPLPLNEPQSDMSLSPLPPPPYSPPSNQHQQQHQHQPAWDAVPQSSSREQQSSPPAVPSYPGPRNTSVEPTVEYRQRAAPRAARPLSLVQTGDAGPSSQMSLPPPPPLPPGGPVSRSPSQIGSMSTGISPHTV